MKYLKHTLLLLVLSGFLIGESWALPLCPKASFWAGIAKWNNCHGDFNFVADRYVGEWKDD